MNYCVVCTHRRTKAVEVVGPFEESTAAELWATKMLTLNESWHYVAKKMDRPL